MGVVRRGIALAMVLMTSTAGAAEAKRFWLDAKHGRINRQRNEIAQVARKAMPAVVSISTESAPTSEDIASGNNEIQKGLGSGFIIHPDGYILTSEHVVEGAQKVTIRLASTDGSFPREYEAKIVGEDQATDVALLKIEAGRKLPVLKLGTADDVQVADWVVVIGNPFGLSHSVSVGVISFKGRSDITPNGRSGYFDFLQTDAAINPGNSGGPILNVDGEVVAIANAVNVSGQGIAFALPIDLAKAVLPQLRADGKVRRSWMGVSVQDLSREVLDSYKVNAKRGVVVSEVVPQSPGAVAGLEVGDVITALNRQRIERAHNLRWQVATAGIDERVSLNVIRNGKPIQVTVKLAEMPVTEQANGEGTDDAGESIATGRAPTPNSPADPGDPSEE